MKIPFPVAAALFLGLLAAPLPAQTWTATNLHPATATASSLRATTGTQQVGTATTGGLSRGAIWAGTAASFATATPGGETSLLAATTGAEQAGYANVGGNPRAIVRNGTTGVFTFRNAGSAIRSEIYGAAGTQEVGYVFTDPDNSGTLRYHAAVWKGPSFLLQDLHPFGADASEAYATNGSQQAGYVQIQGVVRAALWAPVRLDLHPDAAGASVIYGLAGSQQAGYARIGGLSHAAIWAGSKSSFVDLEPAAATESVAYATTGSQQAGSAKIGGNNHAAFWAGSAASFVDLHAFLPAGYANSTARGMWTDGSAILVAGSAVNSAANRTEAILWRFTPNRPPAFTILAKSTRPTAKSKATLRGTRADVDGTTPRVFVKVGKAKFRPAKTSGAKWSYVARLKPGKNSAQIYAQDAGGLRSPTRKVTITRRP